MKMTICNFRYALLKFQVFQIVQVDRMVVLDYTTCMFWL
jgi:hypothetical protein